MRSLKVGLVQLRTPITQQEGLAHVAPLVRQAVKQGAMLILTPEGTNLLQRNREVLRPLLRTQADDPAVVGLKALARDLGVWISMGSALVRDIDGGAANRQILINPNGEVSATYDKIHMFDVDLPDGQRIRESEMYRPGERAVLTRGPESAALGLTICYDMRFPQLFRALALAGAEIITVPSAFTKPTGQAHWETLLRSRAIENGCFILAAAQGGLHHDGRETWGRTTAIDPWGRTVGVLDHDKPGILVVTLDLDEVARVRGQIPNLANSRPFNLEAVL